MVNQEILGGLRSSVNRGESLQKVMATFYNAGYKKEEIEESARALHQEQLQKPKIPETPQVETKEKTKTKFLPPKKPVPKISSYGTEKPMKKQKKKGSKGLLIAIVSAAIIFIGLLIAFLISS